MHDCNNVLKKLAAQFYKLIILIYCMITLKCGNKNS